MEFRISLLFGVMLISQSFHYFIQGNGVKRLHDLQPVSGLKLHRLLLDALKEIALNTPYIDLLERIDLIFPIHDESSSVLKTAVPGDPAQNPAVPVDLLQTPAVP